MSRAKKKDERDVGGLAEKFFEAWMAQTPVTCNPVERDREGWDFFLQFPFETTEDIPPDLRSPRIECVVQVKGIGVENKGRKRVKLSNWEKLTKSLLPAFFLIIDFQGEPEPKEVFLVHVDEEWITKVAKRLRELPPSDRAKLNKRYLYLTWTKENKLTSTDGPTVVAEIKNHIGPSIELYSDNKRQVRDRVGEPIGAVLNISFSAEDEDDMWTKFVDFLIGEKPELETEKTVLREDIRFGIPANEEQFGPGGSVKITDHGGFPVEIVFRNAQGNLRASFSGIAFSPAFHPIAEQIPKEHLRERIVFEFGSLVIHPASGQLNIRFELPERDETHSLNDLSNLWRLVTLMWLRTTERRFVEFRARDGKVLFAQEMARRSLDPAEEGELLPILHTASVVNNAWYVAKRIDIPLDTQLTMDQIVKQQHLVNSLYELLDVNHSAGPVTGTLLPEAPDLDGEKAAVFVKEVLFGELSVLICLGVSGAPEYAPIEDDGSRRFTIRKPRVVSLNSRILLQDEDDLEVVASSLLDESIKKLEERGIDVIAEPFRRDVG